MPRAFSEHFASPNVHITSLRPTYQEQGQIFVNFPEQRQICFFFGKKWSKIFFFDLELQIELQIEAQFELQLHFKIQLELEVAISNPNMGSF